MEIEEQSAKLDLSQKREEYYTFVKEEARRYRGEADELKTSNQEMESTLDRLQRENTRLTGQLTMLTSNNFDKFSWRSTILSQEMDSNLKMTSVNETQKYSF